MNSFEETNLYNLYNKALRSYMYTCIYMLSSAGQTARPIWLKIFLGKPMATPGSDIC